MLSADSDFPPTLSDVAAPPAYRTPRGEFTPKEQSPKLTTHPTLTSNVKFLNFYPFSDIETISPRPLLFITGETAHSREFSEDAYKRAAEQKELY